MSDPFRLRVMKAISAALKTIKPTNGYIADLSDWEEYENGETVIKERVFRGRTGFGKTDPTPLVSILEHPRALDPDAANDSQSSDQYTQWDILIQGFVKDDPVHPTDPAHMLVAEVIKCLAAQKKLKASDGGPNILGLGWQEPCVFRLTIGSPIVRPADGEISDFAFFWLTITLTLVEDLENPFA